MVCARCAMPDPGGAPPIRVITARQDSAHWLIKPASCAPLSFPRERLLVWLERQESTFGASFSAGAAQTARRAAPRAPCAGIDSARRTAHDFLPVGARRSG
jgi:hypothetical protein